MNNNPYIYKIPVRDRTGRVVAERDAINLAGLMKIAGDRITRSNVEIVQLPSEQTDGVAIVRVSVTIAGRGEFCDVGDAGPRSAAPALLPHALRLAATRGLCRCLRVGLGVTAVAAEELFEGYGDGAVDPPPPPANDNAERMAAPPVQVPAPATQHFSSRASDAQRKYVYRLLLQRNISGEAARDFLRRELGVDQVAQADRASVARLIDTLKSNGSSAAAQGNGG